MIFLKEIIDGIFSDVGVLDAVRVTLILAFSSTAISSVFGILSGLMLEQLQFPGKRMVVRINRTMLGIPPVVVGLIVYLLIMKRGPLGSLSMLFTIKGMVFAQVIIITPIISTMVYSYAVKAAPAIRVFATTMGANKYQKSLLIIKELKHEIYFAVIAGFGRSISEVGAVMLVGGNIKDRTRTMTTAIALLKSQGIYSEGVTLGILLLIISFLLQWASEFLQKKDVYENY